MNDDVQPFARGRSYVPVRSGIGIGAVALCLGLAACSGGSSKGGGSGGSTYGISGTIGGETASGVTVTLAAAGSGTTTTTDASGNYAFSGLASGSYKVTPSKAGYTFTPASLDVTIGSTSATGQNFTAAAITYSISGQVTGTSPSGVTVSLTGAASATTSTDASGNYAFPGLASGSYTVTPTKTGYEFAPVNLSVTIGTADVIGQNFTVSSGNWDYMVWDQDRWQ